MAGSGDLLNIAVSGLLASQSGLATTGHNISNVNTPGYTRQRVELVENPPHGTGDGFVGAGVRVSTVRRILDGFLGQQIRLNTSSLGDLTAFHALASQVDNILADPMGGLSPALQGFFGGLQDLAADPTSVPVRQVVLSAANGLAERFHALDRRFEEVRDGVGQKLRDLVSEVNTIAAAIARVNGEIARAQGAFSGQPPNDLLDQRDELVRSLSERLSVTTVPQSDGAVNVAIGNGQGLVTGSRAATLTVQANPFDPERVDIGFKVGSATTVITDIVGGGEMGGVLKFRGKVLDPGQRALGQLAIGLARTVNDQHRLGVDLDGALGRDFFNSLDTLAPRVFASVNNTGTPAAAVTVAVSDVAALDPSEYRLARTGATYTLTRLSDATVFTLTGFPALPETVDGLTLTLGAGVIADGDQFLIRPTGTAARDIAVAVNSPRTIAAGAPVRSAAALTNTGTGRISDPVVNPPGDTVTFTFTSATTFDAVDATTGAALATGLVYDPAPPADTVGFNGFSVDLGGAPAPGDTFTVSNTVTAAGAGNTGSGTISAATVSAPDPNLADPVTITFTTPTTFTVTGTTTGTPTAGLTYSSGAPLSFNGWTVNITGNVAAGDVFTVGASTGAVGDNRNARLLGDLQVAPILDGGTASYGDVYGQLTVDIGTATRQAEIGESAQQALLTQIQQARDAVSGVNLDEEAADLVRFQQAYQASAQMIAAADEVFQSLLGAVAR